MLILTTTQQATGTIKPVDANGNPAEVQNSQWTSSNPAVVTVTPSEDGKTAVVKAAGVGTSQVGVTCDADLGDGVKELTTLDDVEVKASEAVSVGIEWGTPEEQSGSPEGAKSKKRSSY